MRIQQVTAAVTRRLIQTGTRAIDRVDALLHGTDLHLCLARVSTGSGNPHSMPSYWLERMSSSPPVNSAPTENPGASALPAYGKAYGKAERRSLALAALIGGRGGAFRRPKGL
ncbi:MAG: hypothetical protein AAGJ83_09830 [Planctomycetota bacterium]